MMQAIEPEEDTETDMRKRISIAALIGMTTKERVSCVSVSENNRQSGPSESREEEMEEVNGEGTEIHYMV
jgi:hypothetical protein